MTDSTSTAITECPVHSGPGDWYDHGCRGCVAARLAQTERSLSALNADNLRLQRRCEVYAAGVMAIAAEAGKEPHATPWGRMAAHTLDRIERLDSGSTPSR